ncbi:hypothetical protein [Erythrobacter sp. JK5]|uniref:hypothetical protein n=1 Tax=Erythrobacter sp. JK5 TaxID=2829500 RepID=UPI001BA68DA1|nr:hypothetical protein [Erythrobacter sp. JK5]QUL38085.1 hypothetical protein KDC96_01260 [Erythrobacter sp. JK5]
MSGWAIVAIIAIVIWGIVQIAKARAGIITDEDGNDSYVPRDDGAGRGELESARREIEQLRERIHVLERIATDDNTLDARERARISAEIEALRGAEDTKQHDASDKEDLSK